MEDLSIPEGVLLEEHGRSLRMTATLKEEVESLPMGYVRESRRNGRVVSEWSGNPFRDIFFRG